MGAYLLIAIIIMLGSILTNYYTHNIDKYQAENLKLKTNQNLVQCINDVYIQDYTDVHLFNLEYGLKNPIRLDKRLENMFIKFDPNGIKIFKQYPISSTQNTIINNEPITNLYTEPKMLNFFNNLKSCSMDSYILRIKNLSYYNNGILDIPKLNMEVYKKNIRKTYNDLVDGLTNINNPLNLIGKIDIESNLEKKFDNLYNTLNEISDSISSYSLTKNTSNDANMFSNINGAGSLIIDHQGNIPNIINDNSLFQQTLYSSDNKKTFNKLNGGLYKFIQSNGIIFIDSYFNYCFNPGNSKIPTSVCMGGGISPEQSYNNLSSTDSICYKINHFLDDTNLFYNKHLNNFLTSAIGSTTTYSTTNIGTKNDFINNIAKKHTFTLCYNQEQKNSKVLEYLKNITYFNTNPIFDKKIIENIYSPLAYIDNFYVTGFSKKYPVKYDINQWTSTKERKTYIYHKTPNGDFISIANNMDFIINDLNIDLSNYFNPFFPKANFDFFIDNSSASLLFKIFKGEAFNTKITKTSNFLELAIPSIPDIKTSDIIDISLNNNLNKFHQYDFLLTKLLEGLIIY